MKGFWRGFWTAWGSPRIQRWALPSAAALEFYAAIGDTSSWRWLWLALAVLYVFAAGWLWADWARKRRMKRRNAIVVEGARPADVQRAAEFIEWVVEQRKARQQ